MTTLSVKRLLGRILRLIVRDSRKQEAIKQWVRRVLSLFGKGKQSWFDNGHLYLPEVQIKPQGTIHSAVLRVIAVSPQYIFELEQLDPPIPAYIPNEAGDRRLTFCCNICGATNTDVALDLVSNREASSCKECGSSLRVRSVIHALTSEIFGDSLPLPSAPISKSIRGVGMSDWEGYAKPLARIFSYHNSFYHQEPRLDITNVPESEFEKYDFLISSDVMEHVPKDVDKAFAFMAKMLKPGGFLVLTVPYKPDGDHEEFYPDLHEYRLISTAGKTFLYNRTSEGIEQIYDNLVFHGGDGFTLFMRMFSEAGLIKILEDSGFDGGIKIYRDDDPRYGIVWPISWCLTIVARKAQHAGSNPG
ncbi:methyltransferase domain-containing protein [Nitrosomonas sp.]|uniref:class I SAM-dependent methyltransferase n=1 Tax=Nitrosomonas sp. TaxID=42353 RepID=UPI002624C018|nr:methyltransferase domain-containing protein [Nitrosomonas sp.]